MVANITGDAYAPDWSPDGAEIAFYSLRLEETGSGVDVFVVSADGGAPEQLTDFPGDDDRPDWSPDGLTIAYMSLERQGVGPWTFGSYHGTTWACPGATRFN